MSKSLLVDNVEENKLLIMNTVTEEFEELSEVLLITTVDMLEYFAKKSELTEDLIYCLNTYSHIYTSLGRGISIDDYLKYMIFAYFDSLNYESNSLYEIIFADRFHSNPSIKNNSLKGRIRTIRRHPYYVGVTKELSFSFHIANAHLKQKAMDVLEGVMEDAEASNRDRIAAATEVIKSIPSQNDPTIPESNKVEINIGNNAAYQEGIETLQNKMTTLVATQREGLSEGKVTTEELGKTNLIVAEKEEYESE